ncbi:MAG: hypothetical protein HY820_13805 [Acidobacteria bacterium]|nr:hypothetical protein [Acidobacteriota bacterium]
MSRKLQFQCPVCGSGDVFYSCEPKCCFNHVCAECKATFEPVTKPAGTAKRRIAEPQEMPDASDPAVACAKCESVAVYVDDDGALVCKDCGTVLEVELTEVTP